MSTVPLAPRLRLGDRLDDALNPIVVKELRQAVRSRVVVVGILLFLTIQVVVMGFFLVNVDANRAAGRGIDFHAGREIFLVLQGILLATCIFCVPAYAGIRLAAERADSNVDLLYITALRPRSIIWGKTLAAVVIMLLIVSACAPFMTFCYLLRGIDIPTVGLVLLMDVVAVLAATQLAIFCAVVPTSRVLKGLLGVWAFTNISYLYGITMAASVSLVEFGVWARLDSWDFWGATLAGLVLVAIGIGLVFVWSVAIITPATANRAVPVRLYLLGLWLLSGGIAFVWSQTTHTDIPWAFWQVSMVGLFCLQLMIAINERERWAPRVARHIPRYRLLRVPAFLLYSGSAGGVLFAVLMLFMTLLIWFLGLSMGKLPFSAGFRSVDLFEQLFVLSFYSYNYALSAVWLRTMLFGRWVRRGYTWALALLVLAVGMAVPAWIFFMFNFNTGSKMLNDLWLLSNPAATLTALSRDSTTREALGQAALPFVSVWAALITLLNLPWFVRQARAFQPFRVENSVRPDVLAPS